MPLRPDQICQAVSDSYNVKPTVQVADDIRAVVTPIGSGETLVVIPGTTDLAGWLDDFSTLPAYHPGLGWCHEGFSRCGLMLWMALKPLLKNRETTIAGHSLGGALAQVCAVANAGDGFQPVTLTTFGSPRVAARWNMTFGPLLKKSLNPTLYVNAGDPVPDVPGRLLFGHKTKHVTIGKPIGGVDPMANHAIALYLKNLSAIS